MTKNKPGLSANKEYIKQLRENEYVCETKGFMFSSEDEVWRIVKIRVQDGSFKIGMARMIDFGDMPGQFDFEQDEIPLETKLYNEPDALERVAYWVEKTGLPEFCPTEDRTYSFDKDLN
ncbi:hypothetical protein [Heliophilum fasciatum]|uniref:Uncharacterized protein n=1 Tax=Heliophilum fasciatum TaxID=35700 RepID=A0A4R2RES3_9FIRM|nr:hypothetical protein [Heliophilum fasciatum]MCW2278896.1 hypothetical protein [Heliophilum fasciatum]TCP62030.1 hypothetical protein EDD73_1243 [Heliophilum fasciatum]